MKTSACRCALITLLMLASGYPQSADRKAVLSAWSDEGSKVPFCSTEIWNDSCAVVVNRYDAVSLPTIRMQRGAKLYVFVTNPLQNETVWLDKSSAQNADTEDQIQAAASNMIPEAKAATITYSLESAHLAAMLKAQKESTTEKREEVLHLIDEISKFNIDAETIFAQVNEAASQLPPYVLESKHLRSWPRPWNDYPHWENCVLHEIQGDELMSSTMCNTEISNILQRKSTIDTEIIKVLEKKELADSFREQIANDRTQLGTIGTNLATIAAEIQLVTPPATGKCPGNCGSCVFIGYIPDPKAGGAILPHFGAANQTVYTVDEVNMITGAGVQTSMDSLKKPITTITALFGSSPRFEISTGTMFSTLPNRTFSTQTQIIPSSNSTPSQGNVTITKTLNRPAIIPYAAANIRLLPEWTWLGHRRGAFYVREHSGSTHTTRPQTML